MNRRRPLLLTAGLLPAVSLAASVVPSASADDPESDHLLRPLAGPDSGIFPGAEVALGDVDNRGPGLAPRLAAVKAARGFLKAHSALVDLTPEQVDALELVYDQPLQGSPASVVLLRQRVGNLALAEDGLISVGLRDGNVASLTSSAVGEQTLNTTRPVLGALEGVLAAAKEVGVSAMRLDDLELGKVDATGFQLVNATGLAQQQRARLRALPVRPRSRRCARSPCRPPRVAAPSPSRWSSPRCCRPTTSPSRSAATARSCSTTLRRPELRAVRLRCRLRHLRDRRRHRRVARDAQPAAAQ